MDSVAFDVEVTGWGLDTHVRFTDGNSQFINPTTGFQGFTSCGRAIERIDFYGPMGLDNVRWGALSDLPDTGDTDETDTDADTDDTDTDADTDDTDTDADDTDTDDTAAPACTPTGFLLDTDPAP